MVRRSSLILDVAGVLATNFSPDFWVALAVEANVAYEALTTFKRETREALWTGSMSEQEFWTQLCSGFPSVDRERARRMLLASIRPLPALYDIPLWSEYADIHVLSNHRSEWVDAILEPIRGYICSITISSDIGYCKPEPDIYAYVHAKAAGSPVIWYVDDQAQNLIEPKALGWTTILADGSGTWRERILPLIST
ncbi:HAD family hydrolase [Paenibacillus ferrarius]|uniref:HAD family hydrolase n=1 Tax=Paenibacillus ferrarius TaxID=1469647 RepID=UPI003D26DDDD